MLSCNYHAPCISSILTPFPVSESLLCYFATHLACQQLSPQTVKVYMAAIRHMQITMGLPEPWEYSLMPRLHLVQSGIWRAHASKQTTKIRLPITPAILLRLKEHYGLWQYSAFWLLQSGRDHNPNYIRV